MFTSLGKMFRGKEASPFDVSKMSMRTVVASYRSGGKWEGLKFDREPVKYTLNRDHSPFRCFLNNNSPVFMMKDAKLEHAEGSELTFVLIASAKLINVNDKVAEYRGDVPQIWIYAQKLIEDDAPYLMAGWVHSNGMTICVLDNPSERLVSDQEYFAREAIALMYQLKKNEVPKFVEYDRRIEKKIAVYTFTKLNDSLVLTVIKEPNLHIIDKL